MPVLNDPEWNRNRGRYAATPTVAGASVGVASPSPANTTKELTGSG